MPILVVVDLDRGWLRQRLGRGWRLAASARAADAILVSQSAARRVLAAPPCRAPVLVLTEDDAALAEFIRAGASDCVGPEELSGPTLRRALAKAAARVNLCEQLEDLEGLLREHTERQARIYESAPIGQITVDEQGQILEANRTGASFLGRSRAGLQGWPLSHWLARESRQPFEHHLAGRRAHPLVLTLAAGGKPVQVASSVSDGLIRLYLTDVSEQVKALDTLSTAQSIQRAIVERLEDAVLTTDSEGLIRTANPAAQQLFGEPLLAQPLAGLFHQAPEPGSREYVARGGFPARVTYLREGLQAIVIVRDLTEARRHQQEVARASERERKRIGQDLHDDLGQQLTGLAYVASVLEGRVHEEVLPLARRVVEVAQQAVARSRSLARGLYPMTLKVTGLAGALRELTTQMQDTYGVACHLYVGRPPELREEAATHLYRLTQEAMTNAVKHSGCRQLEVVLHESELTIEDDGKPANGPPGLGLSSMHHHAQLIGATLHIGPGRRGGTLVRCSLAAPAK